MSAGNIRTIDIKGGAASYDSDMEMSALRQLLESSAESDLSGLIDAMTQIVVSWPFDGEPTDAEAWDKLRRSEFNSIVKGVTGDLSSLGEE